MLQQDQSSGNEELIASIDAVHSRLGREHRELLRLIADADRRGVWRGSGARDMAHWLSMRQGISEWKARRWIAAAHALEALPGLSHAFASGDLGIDKVVELTRFATPQTEAGLLRWAQGVSCGAIRRRGDLVVRRAVEEEQDADRSRFLSWWYFDEGRRFGVEAELPAAQGAVVARALERLADTLPVMPGEEDGYFVRARRADALMALCSAHIACDPDPDRATVIIHARLDGLMDEAGGCEIEGGPVIHPQTARRLLCTARVQGVIEDQGGQVVGLGRTSREPSGWMMRQLRYRDFGCTFPGCGTGAFTTSRGGSMEAPPIWTTWFSPVPFTIG